MPALLIDLAIFLTDLLVHGKWHTGTSGIEAIFKKALRNNVAERFLGWTLFLHHDLLQVFSGALIVHTVHAHYC